MGPFQLSLPSLAQTSGYATAHTNDGYSDLWKHSYRLTHACFNTKYYYVAWGFRK